MEDAMLAAADGATHAQPARSVPSSARNDWGSLSPIPQHHSEGHHNGLLQLGEGDGLADRYVWYVIFMISVSKQLRRPSCGLQIGAPPSAMVKRAMQGRNQDRRRVRLVGKTKARIRRMIWMQMTTFCCRLRRCLMWKTARLEPRPQQPARPSTTSLPCTTPCMVRLLS